MSMLISCFRRGFTLLELIVVIGIIGVLIGLLLPTVARARDLSYRVSCLNNLKQIGLALHQYQDAKGSLPPGMGKGTLGWETYLLPYLEQNAIDQDLQAWASIPPPLPPRLWVYPRMDAVIQILGCPSDGRTKSPQEFPYSSSKAALTSYLGVQGTNRFRLDGVLYQYSHIRFADITDGASNTLMVGERPPYPQEPWGLWYTGTWGVGGANEGLGTCAVVLGVREATSVYGPDCGKLGSPIVSQFGAGSLSNVCDGFHYWSLHFGGAHFLFANGSARFLTYAANELLPALSTRAGGESAEQP